MIFNQKADVLLYLQDKTLELYQPDPKTPPLKLELPPEVFSNLEILDKDKLDALVSDWLEKNKLEKHKALIVLSETVLFTKSFPITNVENLILQSQTFLGEIPFEPQKVVSTVLQADKEILVIAANSDLFLSVKKVLENLEWEITGVAPLFIFGDFGKKEGFSFDEVVQILAQTALVGKCNFLDPKDIPGISKAPNRAQTVLKVEPERNKKTFFSKEFMVVMFLVVLLAGVWAGAFYIGLIKLPGLNFQKIATVTEKPLFKNVENLEGTGSANLQEVDKKDLTVHVLNGTGIAGQAAKLKSILTGLGFENIEAGNADILDNIETEAVFSSRVSKAIQEEIVTELLKTFDKVSSQSAAINDKYDIEIISGTYK